MKELGRRYGQGLEMESVRGDAALLSPVCLKWQRVCREHLQCGIEYVESLALKRLRYATALPLLIGLRTLALIEKSDWAQRMEGIKISRGEVGKIMFEAGIAVLRSGGVRKLADKLAHS